MSFIVEYFDNKVKNLLGDRFLMKIDEVNFFENEFSRQNPAEFLKFKDASQNFTYN